MDLLEDTSYQAILKILKHAGDCATCRFKFKQIIDHCFEEMIFQGDY